MSDHLARLCFEGGPSSGGYTPQGFQLRLRGNDLATDHVVHLHEIHHATLNDVTAWGSALHVYARLPSATDTFLALLNSCRTVHESLATFASVQIAGALHGDLDGVLAAYPNYVPLYDATVRLMAGAAGANRRQQLANALARLCMQSPVLDEVVGGIGRFRLAAIRDLDRPDSRWSWFLRRGPGLLTEAAAVADRHVIEQYGPVAIDSDGEGSDLYRATDRSHDQAWDSWEAAAYEHLRAALSAAGATALAINGHQEGTAQLLAKVTEQFGDLGLRPEMPDNLRSDDAAIAASVLEQVRHNLSGDRPYAALPLRTWDSAELVRVHGEQPIVDGRPAMIVDARTAGRLAALYRWPDGALPEMAGPPRDAVVAVRLIVDAEDVVIGHTVLPDPARLSELERAWDARGDFVFCVSTSCLADPAFAQRWLSGGQRRPTVIILVDVEPQRFVPRWREQGQAISVVGVDVVDTSGTRQALLLHAGNERLWWLVLADDVTVGLFVEYLKGGLGDLMRDGSSLFEEVRTAAVATITHLLATESFTSFDALDPAHDR